MPVEREQAGAMAGQHPRHGALQPREPGKRCGLIEITAPCPATQPLHPRGNDIGIVRVRATVQRVAILQRDRLNRWQPQAIAVAVRQRKAMPAQSVQKFANLRAIE